MCFRLSSVLYPRPDDAKGGLRQTGELIYAKDTCEQFV